MRRSSRKLGDEAEAAANRYREVADLWLGVGMPYEEGHALLGQGRCLVALGRAPEAAAPLAAAREIFARLGARPALRGDRGGAGGRRPLKCAARDASSSRLRHASRVVPRPDLEGARWRQAARVV